MQEEISLKDLFNIVKKHVFTILALTLIGAILSLVFMNFFVDPKYQSEAQLLVNQKGTEQQSINYSEIQSNIQLINTYRDVIRSQQLLTHVSENIGGAYTTSELSDAVSVTQQTNSQMFTVKVVLDDPSAAQNVLANITTLFDQTLRSIYEADISNIYVLQPASFDANPVSPSAIRYLAIGTLIGLALSVLYILIAEMTDNTVKDVEFLQQLGLTNLGEINIISDRDAKNACLSQRGTRRVKE